MRVSDAVKCIEESGYDPFEGGYELVWVPGIRDEIEEEIERAYKLKKNTDEFSKDVLRGLERKYGQINLKEPLENRIEKEVKKGRKLWNQKKASFEIAEDLGMFEVEE